MTPSNNRIPRGAIVVAVAAVALLLLLRARDASRAPEEPTRATEERSRADGPTGGVAATEPAAAGAATRTITRGAPGGAPSLGILKQSLADYQAVAVYPPWSRVHSEGTADKLTWNKPIADDLPLDDRPGHETIYHFDADKMNVPYGEAITSWIEVVKTGGSRQERLPVAVQSSWVMSLSGTSQGRTQALVYNDEGRDGDLVAGDHVYTNRFVPSQIDKLATSAQRVLIQAVIDAGDSGPRRVIRDFTYAPRQDIEILGGVEHLQDGMLVVTLDVDVHQAGIYTFEANVFGGANGDTAIAYTEPSSTLPLGRQKADLKFFGRAFHDKNLAGPYVVKDVRCFHRFIAGEEENFYTTYKPPITTRPYKVSDFSNDAWDSQEKDETIANISRLIEQTAKGEIGQPMVPPAPPAAGVIHSDPIP